MTTAQTNYTDAQVVEIVAQYQAGTSVTDIAAAQGKSVRSIIAKLSREGVYQAQSKAKGTGRVTKAQLIQHMEELLHLDPKSLQSLEKAATTELNTLVARLETLVG